MLRRDGSRATVEQGDGLSGLVKAQAATSAARPVPAEGLSAHLGAWVPLGAIVATFIAVSTFYNVRVPLYEAPDESAHARYVKSIADKGELPRFRSVPEFESWQPPLYYAVGAAALKILNLDSPPELEWNPNFPAQAENFMHTSEEDFPYSEAALGVHVLRGISTLFGAGTVVFIYLTAAVIFPKRRLLWFAAAASAALTPQFAFISSSVNNNAASFFFASATVYFGLRYLRDLGTVWLVFAALTLSLGALTQLSTSVSGIVPLAAILLQPNAWRQKVPALAVIIIMPLVTAGWFYLRSIILWGAIFPDRLFFPLHPTPIWDPAYRQVYFEQLRDSFWYIGGPMNLRLSPIIYDVLDLTSVLALAGLIVTFASSRLVRLEKLGVTLLSALPVLTLGMLLYFSVEHDFQPQGRHLMVAMPGFAILLPLGLGALLSPQGDRDHPVMLALPALLLLVNLSIFTITLPRYY